MKIAFLHSLKSLWHKFQRDESGIALIYVTAALPVIIGFSLLAIDVGRLSTLQSTLQHGADALALAGAGELDGHPGAITRANNAIDKLITTNTSLFATSVVTINGASVPNDNAHRCYLNLLPPQDAVAIPIGQCLPNTPTDDANAHNVQVTVTPASFNTIFPVNFSGAGITTASATAVAGRHQSTCVYTPMFMCNPLEPVGNTDVYRTTELTSHVSTRQELRRLIELKSHSTQWSPGNFGFLTVPLGNGANPLGDAIASGYPSSCLIQDTLTTQPGNISVSRDAFNVRFDDYTGSYSKSNSNYFPAQDVRKNYDWKRNTQGNVTGQQTECTTSATSPITDHTYAYGLPRDTCSLAGTCTLGNGRMGEGDWHNEFTAYMQFNYDNAGLTRPKAADGSTFLSTNPPSRYELYLAEISAGLNASSKSHAYPGCYTGSAAPANVSDRRLLYAAILNCIAQPIGNGSTSGLVPAAYGKFFITEPMNSAQSSLWTELVGIEVPGTDNSHYPELVQLYR